MSRAHARNPSREPLFLRLPVLLLVLLAAAPLARAQDERIPQRVGPVPHADDPRPLIDLTGGVAAGMAGGEGGTQEAGVDPGTGAFSHSELEVFQPGVGGLDLVFERMHLSNAAYNGPLGWNWDSPLFLRIADNGGTSPATLHDGHFNRGVFSYAGTVGGVVKYSTPSSWFLELSRTGSGTGVLWSLADPMGTVFHLEYDRVQGGFTWYRLKDVTDPNGNRIQYAYGASGQLTTITDSVGNASALTWIASGPNAGRLQTFTAPGAATVTFVYDAAGNLVSAQRPAPDNGAGTANEAMTYDGAHRLLSIRNAADTAPWLVNGYDTAGRVSRQQVGGPGQVITMDWSAWPLLSVTDRLGQITDYQVNPATGDLISQSVRDMSQPGFAWTTSFTWDVHHHLVREVRPDGETFDWTWETSADPKRRDNLLRFEHKSSPTTSGLLSTWSYTAAFNKMAWAMTPRANAATGGTYQAARATNYTYDTRGNMTGVTLPIATTPTGTQTVALKWTWDARGRVAQFTGPRGLVTQFKYADSPVVRPFATSVIADPAGAAVAETYGYDAINRMTQCTRPCACGGGLASATFSYDAGRRLREAIVDIDTATKRHTLYDHDLDGRLLAERVQDDSPVGDGWAVSSYTYDLLDQMLTATGDIDASTSATDGYAYDADGRLVQSVSAAGLGNAWSYDERDLVTEVRLLGDPANPNDDAVTTVQRDLGGRVSRVDRPDGTYEITTHDGYGREQTVTDNLGRVSTYAWDEDDNLLSEDTRSASGQLLDLWTFTWDELGRMTRAERLAVDAAGAPLGGGDGMLTRSVELDASSNVIAVHQESGTTITRTYDLFDRLVSERDGQVPASGTDIEYQPAGQPYRLWAVEGDPATGLSPRRLDAEWTSWDLAGRPLELRDAAGNAMHWSWSLGGSPTSVVDRVGARADMTYDERGAMLTHRRLFNPAAGPGPGDLVYEYGSDADGRIVRTTARNAPFGADQVTQILRNAFGLIDAVVWPDGSMDDYDYDTALRPVQQHDVRGNVIAWAYDAAGRPSDVSVTRASGVGGTTAEHYDYDLRDALTLARNDDYDVTRSVNSLGGIEAETILDRVTSFSRTSRAAYDPSGRLARIEYPAHTAAVPDELLLGWDGADRLSTLVRHEGANQRTVAQYQWMGGRLLRRSNASVDLHVDWDASGRPTALRNDRASGSHVARFDMRYDADDRTTGVLRTYWDAAGNPLPDGASGGLSGGLDVVFDRFYRAVAARGGITSADWLAGQVGSALLQTLFSYDRNENRVTVSQNSGGPVWTLVNYAAGLINQYLSVGGQPATYDAGGNLLSAPGGPTMLAYDYANRPLSWSESGVTETARYDAFGRRISTADGTKAELLTWFDAYALEQLVGGPLPAPVREFTYGDGLDEVIELRDMLGNAAYPVVTDNLGSPVAVLTGGGAVVESYRYSLFGRRFAASPATGAIQPGASSPLGFPVGFGGRWLMNGSDGLLDFRARTYLPDWGRFAQQDPLGYPDGRLNRYQFGGNNPFRKDNWGLFEEGKLNDPPNVNTHVGITKEAARQVGGLDEIDIESMVFWNWWQDKGPNVAAYDSANNFNYHALGRTPEKQEARLRELMSAATGGGSTGECTMRGLGQALHYAQDMVAHRTIGGGLYDETWGHGPGTGLSYVGLDFNPDGPEDATGNELETHHSIGWSGWHPTWEAYTVPRNIEGYVRHLRKLRAIENSGGLLTEFKEKCGPGVGRAVFPRYQGGKPKPPSTGSTGGRNDGGSKTGTGSRTGTDSQPSTTGGQVKTPTTGSNTDTPRIMGPTTGSGRTTTIPPTTGPATPTGGGPMTPTPSAGAPGTGVPSAPTTPGPITPGSPQGPTTPGAGTPVGPVTPGPETGPWKPADGEDPHKPGGG